MGKIPSRGSDQFVLRFPPGMRDQIRDIAEKSGRSMNAEIIARLSESLAIDVHIDEGIKDPEAAFASMKPILEVVSREIAQRYEDRFALMEETIDRLRQNISDGRMTVADAVTAENSIDAFKKRRQSSKKED